MNKLTLLIADDFVHKNNSLKNSTAGMQTDIIGESGNVLFYTVISSLEYKVTWHQTRIYISRDHYILSNNVEYAFIISQRLSIL